jgi:hypothetical protein
MLYLSIRTMDHFVQGKMFNLKKEAAAEES